MRQQLPWLISKIKMPHDTFKAQLTAVSSRLDTLPFKRSSQLQLAKVTQALLNSILQNLQAGRISKHPVSCSPVRCKFCSETAGALYLQTLFCPGRFNQPLFSLFLGTRLCLLHFFVSHLTRLTGTPLVPGTATCGLPPLTFSYSPRSRCCCFWLGLNWFHAFF